MRLRALLSAPALAVALAVGPLSASAMAAPPADLSGEFQLLTFTFGEVRGSGSVNHFTATSSSALTGDLIGTSVADLTCVGYEVPFERSFTCRGTTEFVGETSEALGGDAAAITSRIMFRCSYVTGECTGRSVTVEATGALAGARGVTMIEQDVFTGAGTYRILVAP